MWSDRGGVVKPFRIEGFVARLRAAIRRASGYASSRVKVAGIMLDTKAMQVSRDGVPILSLHRSTDCSPIWPISRAGGRYLEAQLIPAVREAGGLRLFNDRHPDFLGLPKADLVDMDFFLK